MLVGPFTTATQITVPKILPKGTSAYTIHFTFNSSGSARDMLFIGWASSLLPQQRVTINSAAVSGSSRYFQHNHYAQTAGTDDQPYNSYNIVNTIFDGNDHTVTITKASGSSATGTLYVDGLQRGTVTVVGPTNMTDTTTLYIGDGSIYGYAGASLNSGSNSGESIKNVSIRDSVHIPPIMNILGNNPTTISGGTTYIDAGATALDYNNNNSPLDISTVNLVNPNIYGSYSVTYTAIDANGIESIAIRKVTVATPVMANISESGRTYSSVWNNDDYHNKSTIDNTTGAGCWVSRDHVGSWLQIDLGYTRTVTGVVTQGRGVQHQQWVSQYDVEYSTNGSNFTNLGNFPGNNDTHTKVYNYFSSTVEAQYIKIYPTSGVGLRADVMVLP